MEVEHEIVVRLLDWFAKKGNIYPWRQTRDPYRVLIAEIMLQRTKANQVAKLYSQFIRKYPTPSALASADLKEIETLLSPLGLRWRARKVWELGRVIAEKFGGNVPSIHEELLTLPGVGDYVAAAVLCFAYGKDIPVIDANVCRTIGRLFNLKAKGEARRDRKFIEKVHDLHKHVPSGKSAQYNWAILDFAATICIPRKPLCPRCPLNDKCKYTSKTLYTEK